MTTHTQVIFDEEPSDPQVTYLGTLVKQVAALPFGWALLVSVLMFATFILFGFCLILLVVMVKIGQGAVNLLNSRAEYPVVTAQLVGGRT